MAESMKKPVLMPLLRFFHTIAPILPLPNDPNFQPGEDGFEKSSEAGTKKRIGGRIQVTEFLTFRHLEDKENDVYALVGDGEYEAKARFTANALNIFQENCPHRITQLGRGIFVLEGLYTIPVLLPTDGLQNCPFPNQSLVIDIHDFKYLSAAGGSIVLKKGEDGKPLKELKKVEEEEWIQEWIKRSKENYFYRGKQKKRKKVNSLATSAVPVAARNVSSELNSAPVPSTRTAAQSSVSAPLSHNISSLQPAVASWKAPSVSLPKRRTICDENIEMQILQEEVKGKPDWLPFHYLENARRGRKLRVSLDPQDGQEAGEIKEQTVDPEDQWDEADLSPYSKAQRRRKNAMEESEREEQPAVDNEEELPEEELDELADASQELRPFNPFPSTLLTNGTPSPPTQQQQLAFKVEGHDSFSPPPEISQIRKVPQSTQTEPISTSLSKPINADSILPKRRRKSKRLRVDLSSEEEEERGRFVLGSIISEEEDHRLAEDRQPVLNMEICDEIDLMEVDGQNGAEGTMPPNAPPLDVITPEQMAAHSSASAPPLQYRVSDNQVNPRGEVAWGSADLSSAKNKEHLALEDDESNPPVKVEGDGSDAEFDEFMSRWYLGPEAGIPAAMQLEEGKADDGIFVSWRILKQILETRNGGFEA
ncbi:hypothetical protein BT69DRAFT_1353039 [Atractiella rhizophila]|nr:hypothetical protein BT69DRAFT_1353039 [Atractiella rhizophila]